MLVDTPLLSQDIPERGVTDGHIRFVVKQSTPELFMLGGMCANLAASIAFEKLGAQGTNIIAQLGKELRFDVVTRAMDDGLGLEWDPKQVQPARLDEIKARIADTIFERTSGTKPAPVAVAPKKEELTEEEEDELAKHLIRMP